MFIDELMIASQIWRVSAGLEPEENVLKAFGISKDEFIAKYKDHQFSMGSGLLLAGLAIVTAIMILAVFTLVANLATPLG